TFPLDDIHRNLRHTAGQLCVASPLQYQEYDRLRAEAEFRVAVVPPLIALSVVAPFLWTGPAVLLSVLGGMVLLRQAKVQARAANDLLATAAYATQIRIPVLHSVVDYIRDGYSSKPRTEGEWVGAVFLALVRLGQTEAAERFAEEQQLGKYVEDVVSFIQAQTEGDGFA